ncbi:MAG: GNAT family N-acetyltransferase [Bacteroidetes bacterium]|nr:GNAT family N-acetyltransferase [Bacteroidota bacterium]
MAQYTLHPVRTDADRRAFLDVVDRIYAHDPVYPRPLDMDINGVFLPAKNSFFQHGRLERWILKAALGQTVGRIAAFVNDRKAHSFDQPTGGCGFFECIDDADAASLLFDTARDWLKEHGMEAMDGPINFGENDKFWGLLVEGFTHPSYQMPYNPPYYEALFTQYGFEKYFGQVARHMDITRPIGEQFRKVHEWVKQRSGVVFEPLNRKHLDKYARDFLAIYNDAWAYHEGFTPMTQAQVDKMVAQLKMVLISELAIFGYIKGEAAAMVIALPDLNQIFKPWKGKMRWQEVLRFLWRKRGQFAWYRKRGILTRARVVIIGVRPKFQKLGLETGLALTTMDEVRHMGIKEIELSWVGEFNPNMLKVMEATGATLGKRYNTYRYMFDRSKPVVPYHEISMDKRDKAQGLTAQAAEPGE